VSTGKVGIGTSVPESKLVISGGTVNICDGAGMSIDVMKSLVIGDYGDHSSEGGQFDSYVFGWLVVQYHRLYVLNGIRTDGDVIVDAGQFGIGFSSTNPGSALHVADGNYAQFEDNNAGPPPAGDCDNNAERGRMSIDTSNNRLYICNGATRGWDYVTLTD